MNHLHSTILLLVVLQLVVATVCEALNLSFPGGAGLSYQDGVLRIKLGDNTMDTAAAAAASSFRIPPPGTKSNAIDVIQVKDTGTVKGYGAFAIRPLKKGTFLGFYEGDVIRSRDALDRVIAKRNKKLQSDKGRDGSPTTTSPTSTAAMDYVMSLDGGVTFLDGYQRATMNRSTFSPVHLNHADRQTLACNCVRRLEQQEQQQQSSLSSSLTTASSVPFAVAFFTSRDIDAEEELCFDYGSNFWKGREKEKV